MEYVFNMVDKNMIAKTKYLERINEVQEECIFNYFKIVKELK